MFLDRALHFGENLGDQVKGRSPKKLKSLIEVPNVVHVKINVLSFNTILMTLITYAYRIRRPSCPLWGQFGSTGIGSTHEEAIIVYRGSPCQGTDSTRYNVHYDLCLI